MLTATDDHSSHIKKSKNEKVILLNCCTLTYDDVQRYCNITCLTFHFCCFWASAYTALDRLYAVFFYIIIRIITHSHGCKRRRSKSVEKAEIRPLVTLKPFDQSWQKLAWVTTSLTSLRMLNFIAFPSGVFALHIRDFPYHLVWCFNAFLGLCNSLQPTALNGFFTIPQKTPFRPMMFLLGIPMTTINM